MREEYEKHDMPEGNALNCDEHFYGSVTVGERGQIVIPADARAALGMQAGDKLLVMKHPMHHGLVVFKFEAVREFLNEFAARVERMAEHTEEKDSG